MSVLEGVLFLGIAISITAFPMLARIIVERGLSGTSLGTLALAAGSLDDATAWCLLALLLAFFKHDGLIALTAIAGGITYAIFILFIAKPLLTRLDRIVEHDGDLKGSLLAFVLALVMISAYITDLLGIYAVFGSFLIGIAMPRKAFAYHIKKVLEPVATNLLLPLFFVYSGLNTHIGLVNTPLLWGIALIILIVSCFGKGIACWAAARLSGEPNREALVIGTLMNARGLIELILLNIGLDQGLITPTLFTILVLMAIVTTLIASPIFELVYRRLPMTVVLQEL
jgi:Kef-type K+ transport system membrane component KefB